MARVIQRVIDRVLEYLIVFCFSDRNHSPRHRTRSLPLTQLGRQVPRQAAPESDHRHRQSGRRRHGPLAPHRHAARRVVGDRSVTF